MTMANTPMTSEFLRLLMDQIKGYQPPPNPIFVASPGLNAKLDAMTIERVSPTQFHQGIQIIEADIPKEKVYDWSGCRSPSRAKRRYAKGHPQRVKITEHEVMYMFHKEALAFGREWERLAVKAYFGDDK